MIRLRLCSPPPPANATATATCAKSTAATAAATCHRQVVLCSACPRVPAHAAEHTERAASGAADTLAGAGGAGCRKKASHIRAAVVVET